MELHELFPAVQAAEKAVSLNPHWHIAHQTLGRAQMGYGDVEMVSFIFFFSQVCCIRCFSSPSLTIIVPLWFLVISLVFPFNLKDIFELLNCCSSQIMVKTNKHTHKQTNRHIYESNVTRAWNLEKI